MKQQGAALIISLVMLLLITMTSVNSMQAVTMEERMSANNRSHQLAFESAERALVDAEYWLSDQLEYKLLSPGFDANCTGGLCFAGTYPAPIIESTVCELPDSTFQPVYDDSVWDDGSGRYREVSYAITDEISQKPRYIIEFLCHGLSDSAALDSKNGTAPLKYVSGWQSDYQEFYRITAIGYGAQKTAKVMLQTSFRKNML